MEGAEPTLVRSRIPNACDGCKARKVKCDGRLPCGHCAARMLAGLCRYSTQRRRRQTRRQSRGKSLQSEGGGPERQDAVASLSPTPVPAPTSITSAAAAEEETEVPREARLLCDAQGKLVFIGDCAPLSFFQSVRRLVTSRVGRDAFAPDSSRFSVLENAALAAASSASSAAATDESLEAGRGHYESPAVSAAAVSSAVDGYLAMTTGLVQLFDDKPRQLLDDLTLWTGVKNSTTTSNSCSSAVNYLVLAIGRLLDNEPLSRIYFEHGRDLASASLDGSLGVETVQAFVLVTVYMLCSCRINGGFLFFGIAVRAAYSLGLHRTEVNARFGPNGHRRRDRLWQSLRVVDLCLSTAMGRPPATSDDDCTVSYTTNDLLGASVHILIITECIVLDVYSRRKISLQLTEGISRQLRDWAVRWLPQVRPVLDVDDDGDGDARAQAVGACQVLASYHYAVMLVCRPFLMYELCRRLAVGGSSSSSSGSASTGRTRLADACIDAAGLMVETVLRLINRGLLNVRVPLLVSWLFASSLVLGVGLLGGFGRNLDKTARLSIRALDHLAKTDGHARQYSLIAQSLLETAQSHLERRDVEERQQRTWTSSQLFGLMMPSEMAPPPATVNPDPGLDRRSPQDDDAVKNPVGPPDWQDASPGAGDAGLLGFSLQDPDADFWSPEDLLGPDADADAAATLNLFPLLDASGNIDLAHYL
ncbi:hypothetical protein CDD80_6693 [Ophiocordyceps camponoti-rufipedis]|uniref:Zn(2)-C6 fungal-type domain-containing protein n=1 Tax=Ophiocordyceps camponoti-rufipedis TaxID=2004952 RepID=A0A2C5YPQ7_9HYPO|nr:hypothetical protein CDD80_6693 [Ophiocordyceps camponoti-rufipedis]